MPVAQTERPSTDKRENKALKKGESLHQQARKQKQKESKTTIFTRSDRSVEIRSRVSVFFVLWHSDFEPFPPLSSRDRRERQTDLRRIPEFNTNNKPEEKKTDVQPVRLERTKGGPPVPLTLAR